MSDPNALIFRASQERRTPRPIVRRDRRRRQNSERQPRSQLSRARCPATGLADTFGTRNAHRHGLALVWAGQGGNVPPLFCSHVDAVDASNAAPITPPPSLHTKSNSTTTSQPSATDPHTTPHTPTGVILRTSKKAMRLLAACLALLAAAATAAPHHHQHPSNTRLRKGT